MCEAICHCCDFNQNAICTSLTCACSTATACSMQAVDAEAKAEVREALPAEADPVVLRVEAAQQLLQRKEKW